MASFEVFPGRPDKLYVQRGDLNIGAFFSIGKYSTTSLCGHGLRFPLLQQYVEALVFAFDAVNNDDSLLPNVTLGYAIADDCTKESTAVSQALRFLPDFRDKTYNFSTKDERQDFCNNDSSLLEEHNDHFDVVGVIGPLKSSNSIAVSNLLGPAHIPQLSFLATSDELSQKEKYPYFLRVVPPDAYQMRAIVEFIARNGWTYFSVLYTSGSYGELAVGNIKRYAASFSLCIAVQHKLFSTTTDMEYREVVKNLLDYGRARVVVLVSGDYYMRKVFTAVHGMDASGKFIWIGTDGWAERLSTLPSEFSESLVGSFTTGFYAPVVTEFNSYFTTLKPSFSRNPWFPEFWEKQFNCSFEMGTCNETQNITESSGFEFLTLSSYAIDAVYVYAHALHRLLNDHCPSVSGKDAKKCVKGDVLLQYLKNVSFTGYTGPIRFDSQGNLLGKYVLKQIRHGNPLEQVPVKILDVLESYQIKDLNPIVWDHVKPMHTGFGSGARFPTPMYPVDDVNTPLSVCSRLCDAGEQIVYKEQSCCWECRKCRENERLVNGKTECRQCPEYYWPDVQSNFTTCIGIEPYYPDLPGTQAVLITTGGAVGLAISLTVVILFIRHRDARVIKASSRELSFLQLSAILLGYITVIVYASTPTPLTCAAGFYLFCLSFNSLYAPLLVKTVRIFRIFDSGRKGTRTLVAVSPLSQIIISSTIICGQILLCIAVTVVSTPTSKLTHKIRTEMYVELSCDLTLAGYYSFLVYNLTLVLLCSVFAFKTRKLPTNFNESRFISMCVWTTMVIWIAFIPAYVTSSREYLKSLYLSLAILMNHSVAVIFLFLTRLYAVHYVDDCDLDTHIGNGLRGRTATNRNNRNTVFPTSLIGAASAASASSSEPPQLPQPPQPLQSPTQSSLSPINLPLPTISPRVYPLVPRSTEQRVSSLGSEAK